MYCIYTGNEVSQKHGNWDHIIPLSLGGVNQFCVWSDRVHNSTMGSKIDGAVANDPLIQLAKMNSSVQGHSNKSKGYTWKNSQLDGRPVQITGTKENISMWDARSNKNLDPADFEGKIVQTKLKIDQLMPFRFLIKAALGGGYFLYDEAFLTAVDCEELRRLMFVDLTSDVDKFSLRKSKITVCDRFHKDSCEGGEGYLYRVFTERIRRSIFIVVPYKDAISFHVGILGMFLGSMTIPAHTDHLPIDGEYDLGHAVVLAPGNIQRYSFREYCALFYQDITGMAAPLPPLQRPHF